jgi:hypothetical protein
MSKLDQFESTFKSAAMMVMHKYELEVSFARFVKLAVPFAVVQIVLAIGYLVVFVS